MLSDEQILEKAHRMAWRYKFSSDPNHSSTYTFNDRIMIDFARAIEAECTKEIESLRTEIERLRQALRDIGNPIAKWQRELKEDERLDGAMAIHMAKDPETYCRMAREALTP